MSHIIITGATGLAGSALLSHALSSPLITKITLITRRPIPLASSSPEKTQVLLHQDFSTYPPELLQQLKGATACIWAQGSSAAGMSEAEYEKITVEYPLAAAKAFATLGERMNFVYVSGEGADMQEKTMFMFGKIKGRAERKLLEAQASHPSLRVFNVRPTVINPQGRYLAARPPTVRDRMLTGFGALFGAVWKNGEIPTDALAKTLVDLAVGDGEPIAAGPGVEAHGRLLRNNAIRRLAGL